VRHWIITIACYASTPSAWCDEWFATRVISYVPGSGAAPGHRNAASALGAPARMTGTTAEPETITPFQPAWMPDQVVSIGAGGSLVLELGATAIDDPGHRFGIDLIVYGNAFFSDMAWPAGVPGFCAAEGGLVDVSEDGVNWASVPGAAVEGGLPTMAWSDSGAYDTTVGTVASDFLRAVDPAVNEFTVSGLSYADVVSLYDGGAGGVGIDLASAGLSSARFIRLRHPAGSIGSPEVDAVAVIPPAPSPYDLDGSGTIDFGDIAFIILSMGETGGPMDVDGSGVVDFGDVAILLLEMGG
jgi:hypothetical protein